MRELQGADTGKNTQTSGIAVRMERIPRNSPKSSLYVIRNFSRYCIMVID